MKIAPWIRLAQDRLQAAGIEGCRLEAQLLLANALGVDRPWLFAHGEDEFEPTLADQLLDRRERREPLAYILGYREFYGRRFKVTPAVLIPRQETETLVSEALKIHGARTLLDIGTGSGCLAITLKRERPDWRVTASDISPEALAIARENTTIMGADVEFVESDLFEAFGERKFDLIVTNPPYVSTSEPLMTEVAEFEPKPALYAGSDGLSFYRRLASESSTFLSVDGTLAMEVGHTQATEVAGLFQRSGWTHWHTASDLSGTPRVVVVRR